ncbi:hypothetical protein GN956_G18959 [Arapaima gigas]
MRKEEVSDAGGPVRHPVPGRRGTTVQVAWTSLPGMLPSDPLGHRMPLGLPSAPGRLASATGAAVFAMGPWARRDSHNFLLRESRDTDPRWQTKGCSPAPRWKSDASLWLTLQNDGEREKLLTHWRCHRR